MLVSLISQFLLESSFSQLCLWVVIEGRWAAQGPGSLWQYSCSLKNPLMRCFPLLHYMGIVDLTAACFLPQTGDNMCFDLLPLLFNWRLVAGAKERHRPVGVSLECRGGFC